MAQRGRVSYSEHNTNQVRRILKDLKKHKLKKRVKLISAAIIVVIVAAYIFSDFSKVGDISVEGNEGVKTSEILKAANIDKTEFHFLLDTDMIEEEIKKVPMIKKVIVKKNLSGDVFIDVEEADKIAYGTINGEIYLIDEMGQVCKTSDENIIEELKFTPQFVDFESVKFLEMFAKEYLKIPDLIKNQTSDIVFDPIKGDDTRLKFIMVNGKILYLRLSDMAQQLNSIDYEAMMTEYKDRCIFSFEGKHIYTKECD